jgi:hypothetical protein
VDESSPDTAPTRTEAALIEITCPDWCVLTADDHASRLWANEGRCVHRAVVTVADPTGKQGPDQAPSFCEPIELILHLTTNPAGREVESPDVLINGEESNLDQLRSLAEAIVEAGCTARRCQDGRRLSDRAPKEMTDQVLCVA